MGTDEEGNVILIQVRLDTLSAASIYFIVGEPHCSLASMPLLIIDLSEWHLYHDQMIRSCLAACLSCSMPCLAFLPEL